MSVNESCVFCHRTWSPISLAAPRSRLAVTAEADLGGHGRRRENCLGRPGLGTEQGASAGDRGMRGEAPGDHAPQRGAGSCAPRSEGGHSSPTPDAHQGRLQSTSRVVIRVSCWWAHAATYRAWPRRAACALWARWPSIWPSTPRAASRPCDSASSQKSECAWSR